MKSLLINSGSNIDSHQYKFNAKLWKYKGPASWHFLTLPKALSKKIRLKHGLQEEGWGRLRALACIRDEKWQTSIWFDTKIGSYLLPIKSNLRKKFCLYDGGKVQVELQFDKKSQKLRQWLRTSKLSK